MLHCKTKQLKNAYRDYLKSTNNHLNDCYNNCSYYKQKAFWYCQDLVKKYDGSALKIIGYNSQTFSAGFIGYINNKKAFFYITKDYNRFIYIDELEV